MWVEPSWVGLMPCKIVPRELPCPFCHVRIHWIGGHQWGRRLSLDTKLASTMFLDFPAFKSIKNKCLVFVSHSIYIFVIAPWMDWDHPVYRCFDSTKLNYCPCSRYILCERDLYIMLPQKGIAQRSEVIPTCSFGGVVCKKPGVEGGAINQYLRY